MLPAVQQQSAPNILLVRPAKFGLNPETLCDNTFQQAQPCALDPLQISAQAVQQLDHLCSVLSGIGVGVTVVEDTPEPVKPDAVFPNNWISTRHDGTVFIYPMKPPNRRLQKSNPVIHELQKQYAITKVVDISRHQEEGLFLEGTGSMVLDHLNGAAYACKSDRTHQSLFTSFCQQHLHYTPVFFTATDANATMYYHTNVMMSVCSEFVIVCLEAIEDKTERQAVEGMIRRSVGLSGRLRELIHITRRQVECYCGNVLEVTGQHERKYVVMGEQARQAFRGDQLEKMQALGCEVVSVPVPTVQAYGGGGVRCMLAEIFLPRKQ